MNRWHIAILLSTALTICAFECQMSVPGTSLARTPETEALHAAVDALAWQWAADPALPSIGTPRCDVALSEIDLRTATEREWIDELRLCPMMPAGCSRAPGCTGGCATGVVYRIAGAWRVYLSPGGSADGHGVTVRHEAAHVLSWCTGRGLDYGHTHADVWGPQGVVWRRVDGA